MAMSHAELSNVLTAKEMRRLMETVLVTYEKGFKIEEVSRHGKIITVDIILDNGVRQVVTI